MGKLRTIMGYSGFINPSLKTLLIVLFGFEVERTLRVIDIFDPDTVAIGVASETYSIADEHYQINKMRHNDLKLILPQINDFYISLVNPSETANQILAEISKYQNYNVVIAPMNNKFSTIGAALAAGRLGTTRHAHRPTQKRPADRSVAGASTNRRDTPATGGAKKK